LLGWSSVLSVTVVAAEPAPLPDKIETSRDLLAAYGAGPERLAKLRDGEPWDESEVEPVVATLAALRRFTLADFERFGSASPHLWTSEVTADQTPRRGTMDRFRGTATWVRRFDQHSPDGPSPKLVERFGVERFYVCDVRVTGDVQPSWRAAKVFALDVPTAWKLDTPLDEPVEFDAAFLKVVGRDEHAPVMLAAQRIGWHPHTLLGELGMDVGLLDAIQDRTPIGAADRTCFYALLAAAGRAPPGELLARAGADAPVVPLFNEPAAERGKLVALTGTVVRAVPIRVADADIRAAFGIEEYYELELLNVDSQGNPLALCVLHVPPGMPTGEQVTVDIRAAGFFFKSWAYRPHHASGAKPEEAGKVHYQLAPLVIGREAILLPKVVRSTKLVDSVMLALFGGGFALLLAGAWWFWREDRWFRKRVGYERLSPGPGRRIGPPEEEDDQPPE